jgi:hypothetical protein
MSDRCVFIPVGDYGENVDNYEWADVVIKQRASNDDIEQAAEQFRQLPGPHKVWVKDRQDPRFILFARYLEDTWNMKEDLYGYSVSQSKNKGE